MERSSTSPAGSSSDGVRPREARIIGYYAGWTNASKNYTPADIPAELLTHVNYAFGLIGPDRRAVLGDAEADVGSPDLSTGTLGGNFRQLRELKERHPHLKTLISMGGWTGSGGFSDASATEQQRRDFVASCVELFLTRWPGVFDGIDIDWEYPNACGLQCDSSGPNAFKNVISALRAKFGSSALVTAAITADGSGGGKIDATDYAGAAPYLSWLMPMTYDYFGAWAAQGPTAPHSPLTSYTGIPQQGFYADAAIQKLKAKGIPASKLLLGIGFYGRGWTGVTQAAPGGTATGPAPGTYEQGIEDYKVLRNTCPATSTVAGTAYALCGGNWWSYDTPSTIGGKMTYAKNQGLGGAFFWELSGDTGNGELIGAIRGGLG